MAARARPFRLDSLRAALYKGTLCGTRSGLIGRRARLVGKDTGGFDEANVPAVKPAPSPYARVSEEDE